MIINGISSNLGLKRCKGSSLLGLVRLPSLTDDVMPPAKEDTVVSSTTSLTTTTLTTTDSADENGKIIKILIMSRFQIGTSYILFRSILY